MNTAFKNSLRILIGAAFLCGSGVSWAEKGDVPGRDLYREYCRDCHVEGSANGEYTPLTLIQDQWIRFFDKRYERKHKGLNDPSHGNKPVLEAISPEILELIREFAIDHAADSENPMTCG